jgi:phosphonopyruvate decarboxylase
MINSGRFVTLLRDRGVSFFTGVPDSYLKGLCTQLSSSLPHEQHVVAANEGNAVGLAIGHFMGTGKPAVVYMQNSGLGNAVNPLTSLADREVYSVPILLIIGWRGEPGRKDEPQHVKQGRITPGLLDLLEIPFRIVGPNSDMEKELDHLFPLMMAEERPIALLVQGGTFSENDDETDDAPFSELKREQALECLLTACLPGDCLVATTGKTGRELFELRLKRGETPDDFLTVGGMGHGSSIALGAALGNPAKRLICLDGDGALLMHLGAMGIIGSLRPGNFIHVLLNNHCHESVGGQATCAGGLDFAALAEACGYVSYHLAATVGEVAEKMALVNNISGPHFLEIRLKPGSRTDLGRPTTTTLQNRNQFMVKLGRK